ncbi:hypothetical protein STVA_41450 [Allostella vacuolata]|nr:hypothetical protein STVA_41450 [Stella vacuolata]
MPAPVIPAVGGSRTLAELEALALAGTAAPPVTPPAPPAPAQPPRRRPAAAAEKE